MIQFLETIRAPLHFGWSHIDNKTWQSGHHKWQKYRFVVWVFLYLLRAKVVVNLNFTFMALWLTYWVKKRLISHKKKRIYLYITKSNNNDISVVLSIINILIGYAKTLRTSLPTAFFVFEEKKCHSFKISEEKTTKPCVGCFQR